ncbi:MAG: hypothetical protein ACXWZK_05080 [Solirubrobacterales bacterium]
MLKTQMIRGGAAVALLAAALGLAACGDDEPANGSAEEQGSTLPTGSEPADLDPAELTTEITNPYWPMTPGSRWVYREEDPEGDKRVVVTVNDQTKQLANGVEARVVRDVVTQNGRPLEVTDDWYAQDADGNVWYLGEDTAEYEDGKVVSREGSFEAGVDGAEAGVIMPADPQPGMEFRQEFLEGEAEDYATVLGEATRVVVAAGKYDSVLQTEDVNPLGDPLQVENKFYAEGVGPVLTLDLTGTGREELVRYTPGG